MIAVLYIFDNYTFQKRRINVKFTLKQILNDRHWTIAIVNTYTGISRTTLTNIYYGRSKGIQLETLKRLCDFLEITPNDLIK